MAELQALETWAAALMQRLGPAASAKLARGIAVELRKRNMARMRAQQGPDGAAWAPRKSLRGRRAALREATGPMMRKLASAKYLRTSASASVASVGFDGRVQRVAQVHHFGLRDLVNYPHGPRYDYPARGLLGLPDDDLETIRDMILNQVGGTD